MSRLQPCNNRTQNGSVLGASPLIFRLSLPIFCRRARKPCKIELLLASNPVVPTIFQERKGNRRHFIACQVRGISVSWIDIRSGNQYITQIKYDYFFRPTLIYIRSNILLIIYACLWVQSIEILFCGVPNMEIKVLGPGCPKCQMTEKS